ncbi:MAG: hypothetical protein SNH27_16420 [Rikenellaceae bacterium]
MVVKCKKCGSTDVEVHTWVNPNTEECSALSDLDNVIRDDDDCWCKECGDNLELIIEESEESDKNLLSDIEYWWEHLSNPEDIEVITGLSQTDFESNELYIVECNEVWANLSNEQKIEIYRTIRFR